MKTHLVFAIMTAALLAFVISQKRQTRFTFDLVVAQAQALAAKPYQAEAPITSPGLRALNYDQMRDIRWRAERTLWQEDGLPFQVQFLAAGGQHHADPVNIFTVHGDSARWIRYDPADFDFGPLVKIPEAGRTGGGLSGFRVLFPIKKKDALNEVLVFQGASYFRAVARNSIWGLSARGIAVNPGGKEEFPAFRTFWLVRPTPGSGEMTIFALLDGPSLSGAYQFDITPGQETKIRVQAALFPRRDIAGIGIAPLTSMYWYGENTSNTFGDFRPEVHDSDGLQVHLANDEWIWRPLSWSRRSQSNAFRAVNPRGFGLFQRDRAFEHYQDLEANYQWRPGAWVEPRGDWGAGEVRLLQFAATNEFTDNVVAWWQLEGGLKANRRTDFSYVLTFFDENGGLPPLGRCVATRIDYQDRTYFRKVILDFGGGELSSLAPDSPPEVDLWVSDNAEVEEVSITRNEHDGTWRVGFTPKTGEKEPRPVEMRCALRREGRPLTETWTYTWQP